MLARNSIQSINQPTEGSTRTVTALTQATQRQSWVQDPPCSTHRLIFNAASFEDSKNVGQMCLMLEILVMPYLSGAREGYFVHILMGGDGSSSCGTKSRDNIDHTRGKASLCANSQRNLESFSCFQGFGQKDTHPSQRD